MVSQSESVSFARGYLEGDPKSEVAFSGCFQPISFRTPADFADVTTFYTYPEPTPGGLEAYPTQAGHPDLGY